MQDESPLTFAVQYLRVIADHVSAAGVPVPQWLALSGMTPAQFDDPGFALSFAQLQSLLLDAAALVDEPAVGLLIGQRLGLGTHGSLGYALMNSGTVRELLELSRRFISLRAGFLALDYAAEPGGVRVTLAERVPLGPIRSLVLEALVSTVKQAIDAVSMGACPVRAAHFPFADPGYADLARELLGCPVHYGAERAMLTLPNDALDRRLKLADPDAMRMAERMCQREMDLLAQNRSFEAKVRRVLLEWHNGFPSLATTARLLRTTPRTLHRRLIAEGTAFRAIVEDLRHRIAVDHLRNGRTSVEAIAYLLGYANPANFRRAFKRWAGMPPSVYRARHLAPPDRPATGEPER